MDSSARTACHVCGKYFYTSKSLKMHILRVHGKVVSAGNAEDSEHCVQVVSKKGSVCSVCSRCFPNDRLLKTHTVKVHCK